MTEVSDEMMTAFLLRCEERAVAAGYETVRIGDSGVWLEIKDQKHDIRFCVFGPARYILEARVQDRPTADIVPRAARSLRMANEVLGSDLKDQP
jgi:hypothetical protein